MIVRLTLGDLLYKSEMQTTANTDTSDTYKTVNFIVDLPLWLQDRQLDIWASGLKPFSRIVHVPAEFQIVDQITHSNNEKGEASHEIYKTRRLAKVRQRLLSLAFSFGTFAHAKDQASSLLDGLLTKT